MPTSHCGRRLRRGASGFTVVELLVVIAILAVLMALLLPAVQQSREAARRTQCRSSLHQLAIALHNYVDAHQTFPIGSMTVGPSFFTQSGWGWGAMSLPFLEQTPLWQMIDFDVGTAVGTNLSAVGTSLPVWICPSDPAPRTMEVDSSDGLLLKVATGNYCGVESVFRPMVSVRPRDVTDGLSQTLLVGERVFQPRIGNSLPYTSAWCGRIATQFETLPNAIPHLPVLADVPPNSSQTDANAFTSKHPGGVHFSLGDGAVRFLSESMDAQLYAALGTPSGGEVAEF